MRYVREPLDRCVSLYNDRRRQDFYRNKEQKRILVDEIEKLRRTGGSAEDIAAKKILKNLFFVLMMSLQRRFRGC